MSGEFFYYIEAVEGCNLRCAACATGNSPGTSRRRGLLDRDLLEQIMRKATGETRVSGVGLFNWGEPLLHPHLPELVKVVRSYGVSCSISTNLNVRKNYDDLLKSKPDTIYVSTSGFTQAVYERTHKGGDVELLKNNMKALAVAKSEYGENTDIVVMFIRYRGNQHEEHLMRDYARELGFSFNTDHARMTPFEKVLAYMGGNPDSIQLSLEDYAILKLLPIDLDEAMKIALRYRSKPCSLLNNQIVINAFGVVQLCCAVYDSSKFTIADYLETPLHRIQELRRSHPMCSSCTSIGGHVYIPASEPEFEMAAANSLRSEQQVQSAA